MFVDRRIERVPIPPHSALAGFTTPPTKLLGFGRFRVLDRTSPGKYWVGLLQVCSLFQVLLLFLEILNSHRLFRRSRYAHFSLPNCYWRLSGYLDYNFPHPSPQKDSSVYTTAAATPCPVKQSDSNCKRLEGTVRGSGSRSEQLIQVLGKFTIAFTPKFQLEASTREHPCGPA